MGQHRQAFILALVGIAELGDFPFQLVLDAVLSVTSLPSIKTPVTAPLLASMG